MYFVEFEIQTQYKKLYKNDIFQMHMHEKTNYEKLCLLVHMHLKFVIFI